jgi:predicted AlkP superfamily pyrophosphatase or phosphodiesterase
MKLGRGGDPDLLAVSYSSHDLLGHSKGPNSKEMEDFTLDEDKGIAELLTGVAKAVPGGLANVVVVLTADHGIPPTVEYSKENRLPAGRLSNDQLMNEMNKELGRVYGEGDKTIYVTRA